MLGNLTGWHLIIILLVVLLMFGATKLPALAKGVGQSVRIFRSELGQEKKAVDGAQETRSATDETGTPPGRP